MKNGPYTFVVAPVDYPGKKYRGRYAYEHRVTWWQQTEEVLPTNVHVHHKNEQKRDNRKDNLEAMPIGEHVAEHGRERSTAVLLSCATCSTSFKLSGNIYRWRIKIGQDLFYCSRSCQVHGQWKARRAKRAR